MVGRLDLFPFGAWDGLFSGAMLVSGRVPTNLLYKNQLNVGKNQFSVFFLLDSFQGG